MLLLLILLLSGLALKPANAECTMCTDGSSVTRPEKIIVVPGFGDEIDCSAAETLTPILADTDSNECNIIQSLSTICGCPIPENACHLCGDAETSVRISDIDVDTRLLPDYSYLFNDAPSCELMEAYLHSISADDPYCFTVQQDVAARCGCPAIKHEFNETTTNFTNTNTTNATFDPPSLTLSGIAFGTLGHYTAKDEANRNIVARTSASLSMFGVLLVVTDNLWAFQKLKRNVYNQIIFAMAIVDALVAIAALFGNSATSTEDGFISLGERGNDTTCRAQGWFFQFGTISSLLLNASLSTYFLVVIVYNFRPSTLKRIVKYLVGLPVLVGLILAFGALPYYTTALLGCHLSPPAGSAQRLAALEILPSSWGPYLGFFFVPAWLVVAYTTGTLCRTYYHISSVYKRGNRWRIGSNIDTRRRSIGHGQKTNDGSPQRPSLPASAARRGGRLSVNWGRQLVAAKRVDRVQDEVFWQCASYLLSLYLAWFTYLVVAISFGKYIIGYRELWLFITFLYPIQPFLNCLVYFRPRVARYIYRHREKWMEKICKLRCCCRSPTDDGDDVATGPEEAMQRRETNPEDMDAIAFQQTCMEPAADLVELKHGGTNTIMEDVVQEREDGGGGGDEDIRSNKNQDGARNDNHNHDVEEAVTSQQSFE